MHIGRNWLLLKVRGRERRNLSRKYRMGIWMTRILVGQTFSYLEQDFLSLSPIFDEMAVVLTAVCYSEPQSRDNPITLRRSSLFPQNYEYFLHKWLGIYVIHEKTLECRSESSKFPFCWKGLSFCRAHSSFRPFIFCVWVDSLCRSRP